MSAKRSISKKPCPYCGKRLEAVNKLKWRNNLARHLANACEPFQREHIRQVLRITESLLMLYVPEALTGVYQEPYSVVPRELNDDELQRVSEIGELERLMKLEAKPK
jgi:hypothetical protein